MNRLRKELGLFVLLVILAGVYHSELKNRCFTDTCRYYKDANSAVQIFATKTTQLPNPQNIIPSPVIVENSTGSGFFIARHYIATAAHVVKRNDTKVFKILYNGETYNAQLIWTNPFNDIALLYTLDVVGSPVKVGNSRKLEVGDSLHSVCSGLGMNNILHLGFIASFNTETPLTPIPTEVLISDITLQPGCSGGAIYNSHDEVIGLGHASTSQSEHLNLLIPSHIFGWQFYTIIQLHQKGKL